MELGSMFIRHAGVLLVATFTLLAALPAGSAAEDDATLRLFEDLAALAGFRDVDVSELVAERTTMTPDGRTWTERISGTAALDALAPFAMTPAGSPDAGAVQAVEVVVGSAMHVALDWGCDPLYDVTQLAPGVVAVRGGPWTDSAHVVFDPANVLSSAESKDLLAAGVWTHDPTPLAYGANTVSDRGIDAVGAITVTHTTHYFFSTCLFSTDTAAGSGAFTFNLQDATP